MSDDCFYKMAHNHLTLPDLGQIQALLDEYGAVTVERGSFDNERSHFITCDQAQRLRLRPGDVLAVTYPGVLSRAIASKLRHQISENMPNGVHIAILDHGAKLSVMTREDPEE